LCPQSLSERYEEEKNVLPLPVFERRTIQPVELTTYVQSVKTQLNLLDITTKNITINLTETVAADVNWVEIAPDTVKCKDSENKALEIRLVKTAYS
jgi:hypothetical protein